MKKISKLIVFCFCVMVVLTSINESVYARNVVYLSAPKLVKRGIINGELITDMDRTQYYDDIERYYKAVNSDVLLYKHDYFDSLSNFKLMLETGKYIFVNTHGINGKICPYNRDGSQNGYITPEDFSDCASYAYDEADLCVLLACESAKGDTNLAKTLHSKGVKCAIGFTRAIEIHASIIWQKYFCDAHAAGFSINAAMKYADSKVMAERGQSGWTDMRGVYGDKSLCFGE